MLDAEYAIWAPAHHYFGIEKVKGEVETRMNLLK
jgi:hypothetical protein